MVLQNALVAALVQSAAHSVQVTDPGQLMSHTVEPSSHLLNSLQKSCVMNQRFEILI